MNGPQGAPYSESSESPTVLGAVLPDQVGSSIGPYKLLQQIGEGGFGVVYMAEQEQPVRRVVALKIIKPGMDTAQVIARFETERQALALMNHPNIARVLDAGATDTGHPYFVMELVKGVPITEFCDKHHLAPEARLKLFLDVCQAIQHAHHKGIIHRDIKPSNVMVTLHDATPVVKVIDFGVAKATLQKLTDKTLFTAYGQMLGTPAYMSPEQAEMGGLDIDTRSDVYSLGVLLYELLTGTTPLEAGRLRGASYAEMQRLIREEDPPRPSTRLWSLGDTAAALAVNRGLDVKRLKQLLTADLDWVVMKALEKDRNRRYDTPAAFADDIERYLKREPVSARPPSRAYRLKKLIERNRAAVLTTVLVALALVAGTVVSTWEALRATRAETNALFAARSERKAKDEALAAASAERKAKDEALDREAETKAVLAFVENRVFAAARPEGQEHGLGHEITLRKAIETAVPFVAQSFQNQPLIEARLLLTMGRSFYLLGDPGRAAEQQEAARAIYARLRGPDHPDTLRSMAHLANSYASQGRLEDALKLRQQTLARQRRRLGPFHPETLASMSNLASSYTALGRHAEALKLREETLALQKAKLGPDDPETLITLGNIAVSYMALGRLRDALKLREETLAVETLKLGQDHPLTLLTKNNLANSYEALGRYADALRLGEETLAQRTSKLGLEHPDTLASRVNLAHTYLTLGRLSDALKLNAETLALCQSKLGDRHPVTLENMAGLAETYSALGRQADALKLREATLALRKSELGKKHQKTLESTGDLAESYDAVGRHSDAQALYEKVLADQKAELGADHPDTLRTMNGLADCDFALSRHGNALKLREETLARRKVDLGPDHPDTLQSMGRLAESLMAAQRGDEAVPVVDTCLQLAAGKDMDPKLLLSVIDLRLRHFERAKDPVGCRQTAAIWENLKRTDAGSLYQSAALRAVAGSVLRATNQSPAAAQRADAESDLAMAWLNQAVAAGFHDAARLTQDRDLISLHARDDFKKLLAGLDQVKAPSH
jgi:eukaryotic-like serine/threonine-protein kinase